MNEAPMLQVEKISKHYPVRRWFKEVGTVKAVEGISFQLESKKTLAIVGESGCGKTTLAKCLMRIETPTQGRILWQGKPMNNLIATDFRRHIQMIFQDPYGSLNPRKKVWNIICEPLRINTKLTKAELKQSAIELMGKVGLRPEHAGRYPHMFSGGQRQRIGIARALALRPEVLICDEPVSALDISIQAQILNLLVELQKELALSYLFISHDLAVVRHIADEVMVIYLGKVVEHGSAQDLFHNPKHPYTKSLMESTPHLRSFGRPKPAVRGELPSPMNPPSGCAFHKRCPIAIDRCGIEEPQLVNKGKVWVACHLVE